MDRFRETLTKYLAIILAWLTAPVESWLKRMIKASAVCLTVPATIIVAGEHLYPDQPLLKFISQIAAVNLTEATMLLGWNMLDKANDKQATTAQRWLYTALALVAYGVLWAVAIYHGEGGIGIAFRLTLLVDLIYSVWESGILANIRLQRSAARDIRNHRKVRRAKERAEMKIALLEIQMWEAAEIRRINPDHKDFNLWDWLGITRNNNLMYLPASEPKPTIPPIIYKWNERALQLAAIWQKDPKISNDAAGKLLGISGERVRQIKGEMIHAEVIHANGKGVEFLQPIPERIEG